MTTPWLLAAFALMLAACAADDPAEPAADPPATSTTVSTTSTTPTSTLDAAAEPSTTTTAPPSGGVDFTLASGAERRLVEIETPPRPALPDGAVPIPGLSIDGHEIFAIELPGDGPPIVLMHGFPDSLHLYDQLYPRLEGRRVIAFDHVGWGRSAKPIPPTYEYSAAQQTRELAVVMDALDLRDVTLVVHDASGPPGIEYTAANPDRIEHLVLLNTFYGVSANLFPPKGIELHADARLDAAEQAIQADRAAYEAYYRFQMDEFIALADPEVEQATIDTFWAMFVEARPAFTAINDVLIDSVAARFDTAAGTLASIDVRTSVLFGDADPYLTAELAEEFAVAIPGATLELVPGAGHFVQIDAPDAVARTILEPSTGSASG
ncbi:MAG: alpha/beta hydrolase [Actinomycetota bacterium]